MSESSQPRPTKPRWILTLAVLFGLFILWPLSVGPLQWLVLNDWLDPGIGQAVFVVWAPWNWLCQHSPVVETFFTWYLGLWA